MRVQDGNTCLHWACYQGHLEIVKHVCALGGEALVLEANKVSVGAVSFCRLCRTMFCLELCIFIFVCMICLICLALAH
jgi:hypothetical protein